MSFKTPLTPMVAEGYRGNISSAVNLQLHKPARKGDRMTHLYAIMAKNGTISFHRLIKLNLTDSTATTVIQAVRPIMLSVAEDPVEFKTRSGAIRYGDSNASIVTDTMADSSPFNSYIVSGSIGSANIPVTFGEGLDAHAHKLHDGLVKISSMSLSEADAKIAYEKAWDSYQKAEASLIAEGKLAPNNIIVANPNGVIPAVTLSQMGVYSNPAFSGKTYVGGEKKATYIPLINSASGVFRRTTAGKDPHNDYEYGMRESNGRKSCSTEAVGFNMANRELACPLSISLSDMPYETQTSRAENFDKFLQENTFLKVEGAKLSLRPSLGGFTSTFHLSGDGLHYSSYEMRGIEVYEEAVEIVADESVTEDFSSLVDDEF